MAANIQNQVEGAASNKAPEGTQQGKGKGKGQEQELTEEEKQKLSWGEYGQQVYNEQYERWMPWIEDMYLRWFTKDNKASYATRGMSTRFFLLPFTFSLTFHGFPLFASLRLTSDLFCFLFFLFFFPLPFPPPLFFAFPHIPSYPSPSTRILDEVTDLVWLSFTPPLDTLDKSKVTGVKQIDKLQDGVHNLVAGQVGQDGLFQPVGDAFSKEGINRAERQGKGEDGKYMGGPAGTVVNPLAEGGQKVGSGVVQGGKSVGGTVLEGGKSVGGAVGGLFGGGGGGGKKKEQK